MRPVERDAEREECGARVAFHRRDDDREQDGERDQRGAAGGERVEGGRGHGAFGGFHERFIVRCGRLVSERLAWIAPAAAVAAVGVSD